MRRACTLVLAVLSSPLLAQSVPPGEFILLPVFAVPTPGALGSRWQSELWVYNDNEEVARTDHFPPFAAKKTTGPILGDVDLSASNGPAQVIRASSEQSAGLHFSLRIRDLSRQAHTWGTEIPVVRSSDFFRARLLSLFPVPVTANFRHTLRIYQILSFAEPAGSVRIRIFRIDDGSERLLDEQIVNLSPSSAIHAYAQWEWSRTTLGSSEVVRAGIEPLSPDMRFWAFVSVTNNETQHVTVITP